MTGRLIEVRGLCAGYGSVSAIVDIDLELDSGEMVALLGANGAGKTTTLNTIAGVIRQTEGVVTMFGRRETRSVSRRARDGLALLPEQRAVFMGLTVRENLIMGHGGIDYSLALFPELEGKLALRAGLISGGEQQMLALARTLAAHPRAILADELSLGLAPRIVSRLFGVLSAAAADGAGVIIVEQHPRTALKWADRAYVMRRGRIEVSGASSDLLERMDDITSLYL
jgi:branched-chain amino acid transport system ATP-binding protein